MANPCEGSIWRHYQQRVADPEVIAVRCTDPVHLHLDGTWWFVEETWADENGPYDTEEQANQMLKRYCAIVLDGEGVREDF